MSFRNRITLTFLFISTILFFVSTSYAQTKQLNWIGHWKGEGKRGELLEEVKKEFEFLYPDVQVNLLYNRDLTTEGDSYKWKSAHSIVEMIKTGNIKWDVVYLDLIVYNYVAELLDDPLWAQNI